MYETPQCWKPLSECKQGPSVSWTWTSLAGVTTPHSNRPVTCYQRQREVSRKITVKARKGPCPPPNPDQNKMLERPRRLCQKTQEYPNVTTFLWAQFPKTGDRLGDLSQWEQAWPLGLCQVPRAHGVVLHLPPDRGSSEGALWRGHPKSGSGGRKRMCPWPAPDYCLGCR